MKESLFNLVGGMPTLEKVHKIFYDKIYVHPWLGKFFEGHSQESIERRQSLFMAEKMGGDINYLGKMPKMAHRQMFITEELFEIRRELLLESLQESGVPEALAERWLRIDQAFKKAIVKPSIEAFYQNTFRYEQRVIIPKP
ncbi:group 1 truncated hemoglobin [Pseudomonadota bacterium]